MSGKDLNSVEFNGGLTWPKLLTFVMIMMVSSISGVMVRDSVVPSRPDPFTGADAQILRLTLEKEFQLKIEELKKSIPPEPLRERVRVLEESARKTDPDYKQPTHRWIN